jgi:GNAT superfamily N-acetyltransferase
MNVDKFDIDIRVIKIGELIEYTQSEEYSKEGFQTISRIRALSHAHNPRAEKDDCALFLAYDNGLLVGYLGTLPDMIYTEGKITKIFWISCMWVLPDYRGFGVATKLLKESYRLCRGQIFITNYILSSKTAFLKTGLYLEHTVLKGLRAYLYFNFDQIIIKRLPALKPIRPVFQFIDYFLNTFREIRLKTILSNRDGTFTFQEVVEFDQKFKQRIDSLGGSSPFIRSAEEFQWILNYPWITKKDEYKVESHKYAFSLYDKKFQQWFLQIIDKERLVGFMILTSHNKLLRTPYIFCEESLYSECLWQIIRIMMQYKIPTLICHHQGIVNELRKNSKCFIHLRKSLHGFIISTKMKSLMQRNYMFQEGDGDGAFT